MARSGNLTAGGHVPDRFDSNMLPRGVGGGGTDTAGFSQASDRAQMAYDYGYTGGSFHGGSLQQNDVVTYDSEFTRRSTASSQQPVQRRRHVPQEHQHQQHEHQHPQHQPHSSLVPYESAMLYGFGPQQGPTPSGGTAFEVVPQYSTRQSASLEAFSNQFAVPPYFNPGETATTGIPGLSPYLNAHHLSYNHLGSMQRANHTTHPFPTTMTNFTSIGTCSTNRIDAQPMNQSTESPPQPDHYPSSLEEAYSQYQRALRITFDHTRAGRLLDASRSLLEISEWLVTNARDLGMFRFFLSFLAHALRRGMVVLPCILGWTLFPMALDLMPMFFILCLSSAACALHASAVDDELCGHARY